jgi:hypothetical protein
MGKLTLFCVLAVCAAAQPQPAVSGRTVDGLGQPVRKVALSLLPLEKNAADDVLPPFGATSDTTGRFEFYDVPPGRYRLQAERPGYLKTYYGAGSIITLRAGAPVSGLAIRMTEQAVISGKVTLGGDAPNMVVVYLFQQKYQNGGREWVRITSVSGLPNGEFSFNKLAPGRYRLGAEGSVLAAAPIPGQRPERYVLTYYPGVADVGSAETIEVQRGQTVSDLRLPLSKAPLFSVSGSIIGKPSSPGRMIVFLSSAGSGMSGSTAVTGDKFRIEGIPAGTYALGVVDMSGAGIATADGGVVRAVASASIRLAAQQPLQVSGDADGLTIDLDPSAGIRGTVAGAPAGAKLRVLLSPLDVSMPYNAQAEVKADGTFAIPGSFAGRFRLQLDGLPAEAYIKSAMYGKKDALDPLDLAQTGGDEKLEIVLGAPAARISGVVRDEKGNAIEGTVTLIPDPPQPLRTSLYQLAATDGNGRFQFEGVRPGKYRLYAWEDFEEGAQFDPGVTAPFQARSVAIEVKEGERKEVAVTRISADVKP